MAIEIVDLPINSRVIFHSYVSLPEGTLQLIETTDLKWSEKNHLQILGDLFIETTDLASGKEPQKAIEAMAIDFLWKWIFPLAWRLFIVMWLFTRG